jgi:hypothetical protein
MVCITCYERWCVDPDRDAYPQGFGELFAPFYVHNAPVGLAELFTEVSTSEDTFLAFVQLDAKGFVCVYHQLRLMYTIIGCSQDAYSGKTIVIMGNVSPMGVVFCSVPANVAGRLTAHQNLDLAQTDTPTCSGFWMLNPPCFVRKILRTSTQPEELNPLNLWVNIITPMLQEEDPTQATTHWLHLPRPHSILAGVWNRVAAAVWHKISRTNSGHLWWRWCRIRQLRLSKSSKLKTRNSSPI